MTQQLPLEFTVMGTPKGKQIGVTSMGKFAKVYTKKTSRDYMNTIIAPAKELLKSGAWRPLAIGVPCRVDIYAYFSVPASLSRPKKKAPPKARSPSSRLARQPDSNHPEPVDHGGLCSCAWAYLVRS